MLSISLSSITLHGASTFNPYLPPASTTQPFLILTLRLPNMSIAYPQSVSSEQPFSVEHRFQAPISAGVQNGQLQEKKKKTKLSPSQRSVMPLAICIGPAGNTNR